MSKAKRTVKFIVYTALFTSLGILFPVIFHIFGQAAGQSFLLMHIPVLISGLCAGPLCGLASGVLSPFLSCILTSMPAFFKMPFMCIELAVYGLSSGLYLKLCKKALKSDMGAYYASLICAQITGRIVNILCTFLAITLISVNNPAVGTGAAIASIPVGIPGIIIQLLFIPPVVKIISKLTKN